MGRRRWEPPIPLPVPLNRPGVNPAFASSHLIRGGPSFPLASPSWGDRCPTSPQATPGHASAPPGAGAVLLGLPGPVPAGARRPPQPGRLLAEPAAPPPARRRLALADAQPAAAAGGHGPGGHPLRALAQLLRRAPAPHVSEGPGGGEGRWERRGLSSGAGFVIRGGSPPPRSQSGVGWAGLDGSCEREEGRNWEGRSLRGGERVRGGARVSGRGFWGRRALPNFPPSRWTHRWQNINYQFLGKRKRHLVPLRP